MKDIRLKRICVYCGSHPGDSPEYIEAAVDMGRTLAKNGIGLVYGGAKVGLMGAMARTVLELKGEVIGVMPRALVEREVAFDGLNDFRVVESMHERKALMARLADGFIAMPGGLGTIEELFETLTWSQLGFHSKPCGILNINGYYDSLLQFLDQGVKSHFIHREHVKMIQVETSPNQLIKAFEEYIPPQIDKAVDALKKGRY